MPALFPFLSLLLCLVVASADELPVIKDTEAAQYVGKKVEVRGLGRLCHHQPTGNGIYQFRTRIS